MIKSRDPYIREFIYKFYLKIINKKVEEEEDLERELLYKKDCSAEDFQRLMDKGIIIKKSMHSTQTAIPRITYPDPKLIELHEININHKRNLSDISDKKTKFETARSYTSSDNLISIPKSRKGTSKFQTSDTIIDNYYSNYIRDAANCFDLLNQHVEFTDYILRLMGFAGFLGDETDYKVASRKEHFIGKFENSLPWKNEFYTEESPVRIYTKNHLPNNLKNFVENCAKKNIFISQINYKISVQEFAPKVFLHIRTIDKLKLNMILESIDPIKNIDYLIELNESIASGGNSANQIIFTYDRQYLIKTISKEEKKTFIDILPQYHIRMRDYKTLFCRIYGLYCIQVQDKEPTYIIIMKNMIELSAEVSISIYLFNFRLK